nr:39S ribosomal protein L19 [Hymenolepis microstoma]
MRKRLKLREYLELNRNRGCEILSRIYENHVEIPPDTYFIVISSYDKANTEPICQKISRCDALNYLIDYLNSKNFYRRISDFRLITDYFCRGLISAVLINSSEPSNSLLAVDLLHIVCRNIYHTLNKIGQNESVIFAFENVIKEAAFPFLTIISTPNLDALTCSVSWALVNLLKSTNILARFNATSPSVKWIRQLMLAEYIVEALDIQLRPLIRLNHLLIRDAKKFTLNCLDELDFETLFPLFMVLANLPPNYNFERSFCHRLQKHFVLIVQFMSNLIAHISTKCPLFIETVAVSVLPVFHKYIQSLKNIPSIVTLDVLSNLCLFLMALDSIQFPPHENMAVIACFASAVGVLASQANSQISKQSVKFQTVCLNAVICGVIALRKRLDWSTFGGSILSDLRIFITQLNCELSRDIIESFLECIISAYGESSIAACELIGALPWRSSMHDLLLTAVRWMEGIMRLYILPEGVEFVHITGFQPLLAGAILSTLVDNLIAKIMSAYAQTSTFMKLFSKGCLALPKRFSRHRVMPPEFTKKYFPQVTPEELDTYRNKRGLDPNAKLSVSPVEEAPRNMKLLYQELLPHNLDPRYRDRLRERLERREMMLRRRQIHIPEFYVGLAIL